MLFFVGCVWAGPFSFLGLLLALATSRHIGTKNGALVFAARDWFRVAFFDRFNVQAFTWSQCVLLRDNTAQSWDSLAHELVHFKQGRIYGPFMPLVYLVAMAVAWVKTGRPYYDCFLESQARKESGH
jgi:hypothetical protein